MLYGSVQVVKKPDQEYKINKNFNLCLNEE